MYLIKSRKKPFNFKLKKDGYKAAIYPNLVDTNSFTKHCERICVRDIRGLKKTKKYLKVLDGDILNSF